MYVPALGCMWDFKPGSAIVGKVTDDGYVNVYYEGDLYGFMGGYRERLLHAADRYASRYPTVAHALVPVEDLTFVGRYNTETKALQLAEPQLLRQWLQNDERLSVAEVTEICG